jgi:imidazolonepropionase-like amidohydrolase
MWRFFLTVFLCAVPGAKPWAATAVTAFLDTNVVPLDSDRVLANQTVVVSDGRVTAMGPSNQVSVPAGALRIEARGAYLMPGLAEMHGHLSGPQSPASLTEETLFLYLANGVTTVRGMQGDPSQFAIRERIEKGELIGPRLYLGSPSMSGQRVQSVEDAQRLVREYHAAGFDLLKVHEGLSREVYQAIASTAAEVGIPFGGHVSDEVGLFQALESRQATIDHLDNFVEALVPEGSRADVPSLTGVAQLVHLVDEKRVSEVVKATREAGAWVVPTMVLWESGILPARGSQALLAERAEVKYVPRELVKRWSDAVDERLASSDAAANRRAAELRRRLLKALHDGGARVLLGTDSPQIFSVPGFSIHREMKLYVEAGMTPYQVLASGTRLVADYFKASDDFGTVAVGKRADLLLLEANPLVDVANVARRKGVMAAGRWIREDEIQNRLSAIASAHASAPSP